MPSLDRVGFLCGVSLYAVLLRKEYSVDRGVGGALLFQDGPGRDGETYSPAVHTKPGRRDHKRSMSEKTATSR